MPHMPRALLSLLIALGLLCLPATQQHAAADSYGSRIAALRSQIAGLRAQMATVGSQQQAAASAASQLAQLVEQTDAQIAGTQTQLNTLNIEIAATTAQLTQTTAALLNDRRQLSSLVKSMYEMQASGGTIDLIVEAPSLSSLTDTLLALHQVSARMQDLTAAVTAEEQRLTTLRAQETAQQAQVQAAMASLEQLAARQQAQQTAYAAQAAALGGQAGAISQSIAADQAQIASIEGDRAAAQAAAASGGSAGGSGPPTVNGALPPFAFGPRFDAFPYGQCTWYVASLRTVTWGGNADQWAGSAAAHGMPEGMTPEVGAIVVWGAGGGYDAQYGHVAYVRAVLSPTSFVVDEDNFLTVPDQRAVYTLSDVEAFIY